MKISKKAVSLLLAATMILSCVAIAIPFISFDALAADITIDGVSQTRVVGLGEDGIIDTSDDDYATTYENYAAQYLNGASNPTDIVIPGLHADQDYVIQGMTYYPGRDWMLVTAYHNDGTASSKVFALDAATGEFVAMFSFLNVDGTENTDHGGGIAVSEHNIYYSCGDKDRKIAYAPLSAFANATEGEHTQIQLVDELEFMEVGSVTYDSKTAYTAYVCYDEGILWMGNFYDLGAKLLGVTIAAADYNAPANDKYNSMVFGYELRGNSSAEEWDYLKGKFKNLVNVTTASGTNESEGGTFTWTAHQNGGNVNITGRITAPSVYVGEFIGNFGSLSLTEGVNYTIEFTSTNNKTDMYMFSPAGTHCNVKQSSQTTITQLEDGRYRYSMNFTAGLKPVGADSSWPTTQSTDGTYTGTYTLRFDQDAINAGEERQFSIADIKIAQANTYANAEPVYDEGSVGSPSYAIGLDNTLKDVQYATVDNGKLYLSRSYGSGAGNSINFGFGDTSFLTVADIDLSMPGTEDITIATASGNKTIKAYDISNYSNYPMMPMSEGLCVIDGDIFITFEGASNKYLNESSGLTSIGNCEKPVDVIWQLDPYELMEVEVAEPEKSIYYEKIKSLSEIKSGEEYIIVHESKEKDPVTQMPYLYAFDAFGNFKDYKLTKSTSSIVNGYDGMIGHPISYYSIVEDETDGKTKLYLDNPEVDDVKNIRWTLESVDENNNELYRIKSTEPYFANYNCFYFDQDQITMAPSNATFLSNIKITPASFGEGDTLEGGFWMANSHSYFLWCNDGDYNNTINSHYIKYSGQTPIYSGTSEQKGTFHCDALNSSNIIGKSIPADGYYRDGVMNIYRRVVDDVASTYESRVYTNLEASLQADGTYTVELQTYAISPNHYQYVGERPTDYIIVADTSSSMADTGSTGIAEFDGDLKVNSLCVEANTSDDNGTGVSGYGFSNPEEDIYFKHTDGKYYKAYMAVNTTELKKVIGIISSIRQKYYVYYIADDGLYYCVEHMAINPVGRTYEEFKAWVNAGNDADTQSEYSTQKDNSDRRVQAVYNGPHYRFDNIQDTYKDEHIRLDTLKETTKNLVDQIAAQNADNRIALVQYGSDGTTGFYNTSGGLTTTDYANAFWSTSAKDTLNAKIEALATSTQTSNTGIEMDYVNNIISNSGVNYKSDGSRNLAVIFISDGIPGADANSATATAANNVISKALTAKNSGAFVYSVLIGNNDVSGFDKKTYMDAVSSKYAAASSMTSLGGQSVDGINYALNIATCTINNFVNFGEQTCAEVASNNAVGLDNLDANSYLREQLSDAFIFPETGWSVADNVKTYYASGVYDAIGRFQFETPTETTEVTTDVDTANRTITVTNYDYSKYYISEGNTDGKALVVTITGLLANENAKIQNTSINDTDTTGLYKTETNMNNNVAFKMLPTEYFNIPTYTFTLDFGYKMLDTDVNGTLCAVSDGLTVQDTSDNYKNCKKVESGMYEIQTGDQNLIYSLNPDTPDKKGYVLIHRTEGENPTYEYDWFCIQLAPASNVYYEQNDFTVGTTGTASWTDEGKQIFEYQDLSDPETDVYGYDAHYDIDGEYAYSNGTAKKVTINKNAKKSDSQTFEFYGTGFDLVSACGARTGTLAVKVTDEDDNLVKAFLVDTYYRDATILAPSGEFDPDNDLLYQVPVVSFTSETEANYKVEVTALYLSSSNALKPYAVSDTETISAGEIEATSAVAEDNSSIHEELADLGMEDLANAELELVWFDENSILNGGTGAFGAESEVEMAAEHTDRPLACYLDGFRIYHPLGKNSSNYIESEQGAQYVNVINNVVDNKIGSTTDISTLAYVVSNPEEGTLGFGNYQKTGPQNELYLKPEATDAVVLKVSLPTLTAKIHLGLRAVTGTAKVTIGSGDAAHEFEINSATEMYYDITKCLDLDDAGIATITIQNTGTGMLAVNNIKMTGNAAAVAISEDDISMFSLAMNAPAEEAYVVNGTVTTEKPEEPAPEPEEPAEKTFIEKAIDFFRNIFAMVVGFVSDVIVFISKGGLFNGAIY